MLLDDLTGTDQATHIQSIAHGVILLEQMNPNTAPIAAGCGSRVSAVWRFAADITTTPSRRAASRSIRAWLPPSTCHQHSPPKLASGIPEIDSLLGGGIEQGTSTLIVGAAGTGKSTLAVQFAAAAAGRGQKSALYIFDESPSL